MFFIIGYVLLWHLHGKYKNRYVENMPGLSFNSSTYVSTGKTEFCVISILVNEIHDADKVLDKILIDQWTGAMDVRGEIGNVLVGGLEDTIWHCLGCLLRARNGLDVSA